MYWEGCGEARMLSVVGAEEENNAYTMDCAFSPIYKVNFVELITPIVARENY